MSTLALLLWGSGTAGAQSIVVNIDEQVAAQFGIDPAEAESGVSSSIDSGLNIADQAEFLEAMANAAAMSSKGMGVDYASNIKTFMFGVSFGSAVNSAGFTFGRGGQELPDGSGFSLQLAAMAGVNLGFGNEDSAASRFKLYVNGMTLGTSGDIFDGSLYNLGAHLQLQLAKPRRSAAAEWGGLAVTSGYDVSGYALQLSQALPVNTDIDGNDLTWDATGTYDITAATTSIPVELSTNVRVAIVTVFAGGGVDIQQGDASSVIGLSGPLEVSSQGQQATLGAAAVTLDGSALADAMTPRVFGGVQAGLGPFQVYGQLNVGFNDSIGGHVGARLAR